MSSGTNGLKIYNTTISGQALIASLTGKDILELQYDGAINGIDPIRAPASVTANDPSINWLIQGVITPVPFKHGNRGDPDSTGYVSLGSDTATVAKSYLELFNLTSSNQSRVVRVVACDNSEGIVSLTNESGTTNYVRITDIDGVLVGGTTLISSGNIGKIVNVFVTSPEPNVVKFQVIHSA
jgi:hypothetical protein